MGGVCLRITMPLLAALLLEHALRTGKWLDRILCMSDHKLLLVCQEGESLFNFLGGAWGGSALLVSSCQPAFTVCSASHL